MRAAQGSSVPKAQGLQSDVAGFAKEPHTSAQDQQKVAALIAVQVNSSVKNA